MRRALLVGIDDYPSSPLTGCVNDTMRIARLLQHHHDGAPNFECVIKTSNKDKIDRSVLVGWITKLFEDPAEVALFYFSGHGYVDSFGGQLVTPDADQNILGVTMEDLLTRANQKHAKERIIIADCCYSGAIGSSANLGNRTVLTEGTSILAASRKTQTAMEKGGAGVFTSLLCDGLDGGASDVLGKVTTGSLYSYVDEALGAWDQRPMFKTDASRFLPLRMCAPVVALPVLRLINSYFKTAEAEYPLDPSFEPSEKNHNPAQAEILTNLQRLRAARLVEPVGTEHMYYAAMQSLSCRLTPLGRHYWRLASTGKI